MSEMAAVAGYVLAMHDRLGESEARQPACDEGGMPLDSAAWLRWRMEDNEPAYRDWRNAMDALDRMHGEPVGRHPFTFRPFCERIISGAS